MRIFLKFSCFLTSMMLVLASVSCVVDGPSSAAPRQLYQWYDDGGPGKVSVRVSLSDQIANFERGGRPIGWCYVATGKEGHHTSPGNYVVMEKIVDKYSNFYGWIEDESGNVVNGDATPSSRVGKGMVYVPAPMPYWLRLTSYGIGMHGGVIPEPGKPASHGCIRMPKDLAPLVYEVVEVGTPITITGAPSMAAPMLEPQSPQPWVGNSRVIASRPLTGYGR